VHGQELWHSDGTAAGTALIDICLGLSKTCASDPREFTPFNGKLYFRAATAAAGRELFSVDSTNSVAVQDLVSGTGESVPTSLTVFNGKLYFSARDATPAPWLWEYDGSTLIKRYNITASKLTVVGNNLFFNGISSASGAELWVYNGVTNMVREIRSGVVGSNPDNLTVFNGKLYFSADDGVHGQELWVSDGTAGGTQLVRDICPGVGGSINSVRAEFTPVNGQLFFGADDCSAGAELWVSDGTGVGTQRVKDIYTGTVSNT